MKKRNKVILFGLIVAFLGMMMVAAGQTTSKKVYPSNVTDGQYAGESVVVKGKVTDLSAGSVIRCEMKGRYGDSITVVHDGVKPASLKEGQYLTAKGTMKDGTLQASKLVVDAHSGSQEGGPPEAAADS